MYNLFDDFKAYQQFFPRTYVPNSCRFWERTELLAASSIQASEQPFCEVNEQVDPDFIEIFGTDRPLASQYLLHRAPGWDSALNKTPLLLVHGAALDANSYTDLFGMGHIGLQQHLIELGHRVFSLTFPHSHGDNFNHAELIADAIQRIRNMCRVPEVDIVAHSKGGIAARIYLSSLSHTPYRGDVRRFVTIGTPHLGTDWVFRNSTAAYLIYLAGGNGVMAWDSLVYFGGIMDIAPRAIYADGCFPGQSQILHDWENVYPLDPTQTDWWTTYHGGMGFFSHSRGINQALHDGGALISRLERKGLEPDIELAVLAGDNHIYDLVALDSSGPSDGIVFVDSALNTDGMLTNGAQLISKEILPYNHLEILWKRKVADWIHLIITG